MNQIVYTNYNTHINDSYLIKDIENNVIEIIATRKSKGYPVTRTIDSYIREWKAHNRLYKLGLFKTHTKDVDLEENISKTKELIYLIIGGAK